MIWILVGLYLFCGLVFAFTGLLLQEDKDIKAAGCGTLLFVIPTLSILWLPIFLAALIVGRSK